MTEALSKRLPRSVMYSNWTGLQNHFVQYFVGAAILQGFTCMEDIEKIVFLMTGCEYNICFKLITCRAWLNRIIVRDKTAII